MGTTIGATVGRSSQQNNTTSTGNTEGGYFLHFDIIRANLLGGFRAFERDNNNSPLGNNNNNNSPLLLLSGFEGGLEGGFNLPSKGNAKELDPNVTALVNTLTGANLRINHIERESNHVKLTEFGRTEAEDPNEWLEQYNRIAEANKWSEH